MNGLAKLLAGKLNTAKSFIPSQRMAGSLSGVGVGDAAKGVLLGEGANTFYRFSTDEDLPPAVRFGSYLGGAAALKGNLGKGIQSTSSKLLPAATLTTASDQLQKATRGYSSFDPKAVKSELEKEFKTKADEYVQNLTGGRGLGLAGGLSSLGGGLSSIGSSWPIQGMYNIGQNVLNMRPGESAIAQHFKQLSDDAAIRAQAYLDRQRNRR